MKSKKKTASQRTPAPTVVYGEKLDEIIELKVPTTAGSEEGFTSVIMTPVKQSPKNAEPSMGEAPVYSIKSSFDEDVDYSAERAAAPGEAAFYLDTENKYRFRFILPGGGSLGISAPYGNKFSLKRAYSFFINAAATAEVSDISGVEFPLENINTAFLVYTDSSGMLRYRLKNANGITLFTGPGFKDKEKCLQALKLVKEFAAFHVLKDKTK